jgi:inosine-uridine nucleoside N-ribohydrolase
MDPKPVWIDADLAIGMRRIGRPGYSDVDDGYAIWQLMAAEEVELVGLSAVFGNTSLENAVRLCQYMNDAFYEGRLPVYPGAAGPIDLRAVATNPAVEALANALEKQRLTIMAIGPATNVGLLLLLYPELAEQITEVVLVAGRRHGQDYFLIGNQGRHAPDLNFDLDNDAFRVMFDAGIPLTFCPFEISHKVWLTAERLDRLLQGSPATQWLATHSRPWLQQWLDQGAHGFNPFDVLASHYLIAPKDIISEPLNAHLEIHPDDLKPDAGRQLFKQYLVCDQQPGYPVTYCYDVVEGYHERLMERLGVS